MRTLVWGYSLSLHHVEGMMAERESIRYKCLTPLLRAFGSNKGEASIAAVDALLSSIPKRININLIMVGNAHQSVYLKPAMPLFLHQNVI